MVIDGKEAKQVIIVSDNKGVLAVITDEKIIEKDGVSVIVDWV